MEIIVKVTDAELVEMGVTTSDLQACIWDDIVNSNEQCVDHNYSSITVGVINTDDAKRAIKTTKDKTLAITSNDESKLGDVTGNGKCAYLGKASNYRVKR